MTKSFRNRTPYVVPKVDTLEAREKAAFRVFDELGDKKSYDRWQAAKKARQDAL